MAFISRIRLAARFVKPKTYEISFLIVHLINDLNLFYQFAVLVSHVRLQ